MDIQFGGLIDACVEKIIETCDDFNFEIPDEFTPEESKLQDDLRIALTTILSPFDKG